MIAPRGTDRSPQPVCCCAIMLCGCWPCAARPPARSDELKSLERGRLQLAANEYTCMYLLPAIDAFRREFPHIECDGASDAGKPHSRGAEPAHLRDGCRYRFDLMPAQFRTIAVYGDSLAFIVSPSHPLAKAAAGFDQRSWPTETSSPTTWRRLCGKKVIEAFQRYRTPLNMGIDLPTIEAIKRFVAMGNGVALVPHLTVAHELETGELVRVAVDELEFKRVLRLVHRRQATLSYAARAFLKTVRSMAEQKGPPFYYHAERTA